MAPPGRSPGDDEVTEPLVEGGPRTDGPGDRERFLPGEIVASRYRIRGIAGRGGMGEVYRADDLKLGTAVALKFLPPEVERDPEWLERLFSEVRSARQVAHPNVCRVFDVGEAEGQHFLAMEFVDGEDLRSLLRRIGRLPQAKAIELARQLSAGLAAAHDQGILHRDLKPANVMIDDRGRVKITDFGLAGLATEIEGAEVRSGTPAYMAPEQLAGREVTARSDLYALGLVLFELFTGERPFVARSAAELRSAREGSAPTPPSTHVEGLDPAVERAILGCLAAEPEDRPESALAVAAALPGGDPLAAALAAGETPSPEMVAAAPTEGTLSIAPAVGWLLLAIAMAAVALFVMGTRSVSLGDRPPEALADRAREHLEELGFSDTVRDSAYGFSYDPVVAQSLEAMDRAEADRLLAVDPSAPVRFWYRESPGWLTPLGGPRVTRVDPPPILPGMRSVEIDTEGRLLRLDVVPDPDAPAAESPVAVATIFDLAGLDAARFVAAAAPGDAASAGVRVEAWEAVDADSPLDTRRLEVGWARGRPVSIAVEVAPTGASGGRGPVSAPFGFVVFFLALQVVALIAGLALVRRSLAAGRGDTRGARRLAIFFFAASLAHWLFRASHTPTLGELDALWEALARALLGAAVVWALYLGLEPFARRRWPETMISWTRLLSGRVRDPLVGRDLLIGTAAGWLSIGLFLIGSAFEARLGQHWSLLAPTNPDFAVGLAGPLAHLARNLFQSTAMALGALILLVGLAYLLRRDRWALGVFLLLQIVWFATFGESIELALAGVLIGTTLTLGLRYLGLLFMVASYLAVHTVVLGAISGDLASWNGPTSWVMVGLTLALALYGFVTCLERRTPAS